MRTAFSSRVDRRTAQSNGELGAPSALSKRGAVAAAKREIDAAVKRIIPVNPLARRTRAQRGLKD